MEMMKRVLALLLVCAMLMPNLTTIASATEFGEDPAAVSTEPVVVAEEPEETEVTEAATEALTLPSTEETEVPAEETEAPTEQTEPPVTETEPSEEESQEPVQETESFVEETKAAVIQESITVEETITAPVANEEASVATAAEPVVVEINAAPESDYSNDDMLAMYLEQVMYPNKPSTLGTGGYDNLGSTALKNLYTDLKAELKAVADNGGDTVFTFRTADLEAWGFVSSFSAETLGITDRTDVSDTELGNLMNQHLNMDVPAVVNALLADCPYEMYWYDKVTGCQLIYDMIPWVFDDGSIEHVEVDNLKFTFTVADNYIGEGDADVTPDAADAAAQTVAKATSVVKAHESGTDLEKLHAYKQWIMATVSYDHNAADKVDFRKNNDPWQIIHVFDENSETNVVCEGYSKAFQYLCDLSTFANTTLESFLVTGYAGGPHMWNIVSIDGRNYLVDVTNSDPDDGTAFGDDGSVFLAGVGGSIADGYTFTTTVPGYAPLTYTYSYQARDEDGNLLIDEEGNPIIVQDSINIYGSGEDSILNLSDISYDEYLKQQEQEAPPQKVERESYISLRFLENHGHGWFEDQESGMSEEIHTVPDQDFYLIAYLNHWNYDAQEWEVEPIHATKLVVDEKLVLEPFSTITDGSNHTLDGENFDCFFRLRAADGANNGETSIFYSNTEIQAKVTLGRTPGGFYSADPTQQTDYDALWLNEFYVGEENTFWFYYDASRDYETGWSVNSVTATADREIGGDVLVEKVQDKDNLYTVTISDAVAANIYELRDFWLNLDFTLVKGEDSRTEHVNVNVRATDFGDGNATFTINGERYHASWNYDGLFTYEGEEGREYPVPASVPGVSYDIETNTLTLNGAALETLHINHHWHDDRTGEEGYDLPDARFNIELVGNNSISATNDHALVIDNEVYLTIQGDGSLAISTTGDENNTCSSAFLANNSDVTIAGNANVTVSISGSVFHEENGEMRRVNMNPIWCNGADRWLRLQDNATLTTHIPDGVCTNGYFAEGGTFVEEGGYNGIQFFYIEVNDNATLNTQTLQVWDEGRGNAYGAYYQNGGTVNITGIPNFDKDHVSEDTNVTGHYHFSGLEANYGKIEINGGSLNIDITATEAQMTKSTYYHGLQSRGRHIALNGGEINFTANIHGTGVKVGEDDWDGGTNAWADLNGATLNMIGTDIYRKIVDVAPNGSMNFNGGIINAKPADIEIRGSANWNGTQANLEGCGIRIQGTADFDNGMISVKDGFFQVVDNGNLTKRNTYVDLENTMVGVSGRMRLESGAFTQSMSNDGDFLTAFSIARNGQVELCDEAYLEIKGTGKVDGIYNEGTFRQMGGTLVADVDETVKTADQSQITAALYGPGKNSFEDGYAYLDGYYGLFQFNEDENSGLYVSGKTMLEAVGQDAAIITFAPAVFAGGNVNAFAQGKAYTKTDKDNNQETIYPYAVIVENDEGGTNASLTITGGSHYFGTFENEKLTEQGRGLCLTDAPFVLTGGELDIEAEMALYVENEEAEFTVPVIISNETGAVLPLSYNEALGAHTLLVGENYARSVAFRTSRNCGENVTWDLTDGVLTISGTGDMDDYYMPIRDPDSWRTAPWYTMRDLITKVVVEEGIEHVGDWAFGRLPEVTEIVYSSTVNRIDMSSNYDCPKLEKFTVAEGNEVYSVSDEGKVLIENGSLVRSAVKGITSYKAGDDIRTIGMGAFDSSALTELDLNQVTTIQTYAFADCYDLKTVVIPEGVTTIELTVFQNSGIESITIPASVTKIRNYAFDGCSALADVIYQGTESQWNEIVIGTGNNALTSLPITFVGISEEAAGAPYLSYRLLRFGDQGYYEVMDEAQKSMTIPVGFYPAMVVYLNVWNPEAGVWERWTVDPEQLYSESADLEIGAFRHYQGIGIEEGEPNAYNFFEMAFHSGWGETRELCYQLSDGTVVKLPITLNRSNVGFYSEDPTNMTTEQRNTAWLNYYPINPNVSGHSVYFALLEYDGDFTSAPTIASDRLSAEDLAKVQVTEINKSVYKITMPDEVAAKVYDYRGIPLKVTYQYGEVKETVEFIFGSVSFAGECYSFVINGIWYEYYPGLDGYFSWDEKNQKRLAHKELPAGMTYDYERDVLTMNNSTIESLQLYWNWHDENTGNSGYNTKDSDLILKLVGENKIVNPGSNSALAVGDGLTLTITGDASSSLLISTTNENATANSYSQNAVNIYNGADLIIAGDTTVTTSVSSGGKQLNNAWLMNIWAGGNNSITVQDNATLNTTVPEDARDDGDGFVNGYEGIGWFGELRIQDNAKLNTSTLALGEYHDENNAFCGKGSYVQTGGTVTIEALGFTNEEGRHGYHGFFLNDNTDATISGGKLTILANADNVAADKPGEENTTYAWFSGIESNGRLYISGETTVVEIISPDDGTGLSLNHNGATLSDGATLKFVGNGKDTCGLDVRWNSDFQLNGGKVDITDSKVIVMGGANLEIHDGELSVVAKDHPSQTYLETYEHSDFKLHDGTVVVDNGITADTPNAVYMAGYMELNGGTMRVSGTNALCVNEGGELNQNGTVLNVKGFEQVMTVGNGGVIHLNGGITEAVLGEKSKEVDGGDIDISGWSLRTVSTNVINTWSSAVNVYNGGRLEVNDGHHTFWVDGTPGTDSEGNAVWLGALDVNGEVNFNGGIVQLNAGTGGQAIFNRSTAEGTTVSFNHDMGAVSAENGISLAMYAHGDDGNGEYYFALGTEENAAVSNAKITRTSAGSQSSWRIEKDGTKTTLIISGSENMYNYYMPQGEQEADWEKTPWYDYTDQITHVVVEDGINHIGDWVFARMTNLVNVKLPRSVNHISTSAFYGCTALENFTMQGNSNYHLDENIRGEADDDGYYTGNVIIEGGWKVLLAAPSVTSYEVPHFIFEIGNGAFQNCTGLTSLSFADNNGQRNLWNIGNNAFENTGLTELELPQGISAIGRNAFADCGDLKTIHLPDTVGAIRPYAFSGCGNVTTVTYAGSQEDWSAISIGTGNGVLDKVTFGQTAEGGGSYLSYHWLNIDENGWQENEHSATTEVHTPAGVYMYGVFYHNHWDNVAGKWVATPVIPTGDASLTIEKIDEAMMEAFGWKIAEGETNADYFVRVAVAEDAWDTDAKNNGIVTYNGLTLDIQIHRDECGFYSGTMASDATWLNEYALNPLKPYNNEFYFIFENSAYRTMDDSSFRLWNHNGIPDSYFRTYDVGNGIFKIVLDPVFLQDAWEYGDGFRLYASCNVNVAGQNEQEYKEIDFQIMPMDLSNPDAVLEINDMAYLYFKDDNGWMTYGDPANDYRPGVVQLPAGVSYYYSNDTQTLTLTNAKLNNLSLGHKIYDGDGNPTGEILLPRDQLTLNLVGSNDIETGHRNALNIHGNLNVTVTGPGSLRLHSHNNPENRNEEGRKYAFDTLKVENGSTLNIAGGHVTAEISGEGYWNEDNHAMPAAVRGEFGSSLVVSGGSLTTVVPENARDNGPGEVDFEDYYSTHAIGEFESITVTGGTLNTTSLYVNSGESYEQSGGTVNITALGHISRQQDDRGNQFQNYHYNGIQIHSDAFAEITGGQLNLTVTPEGWEHGSSSYYSGLSVAGGELTISDQAKITVTGAFEGNAISVGYDYDEQGKPFANGTLNMTGGTLTLSNEAHDSWMYGVDVNEGCTANITGGTLNLTPDKSFAGISNWGTMTIGGSAVVNLNREVVSGGKLTVDGAAIHVTHAEGTDLYAWDIIPGSSFDFKSGTINAKNAAFHIGGEMTIGEHAELILENSDFHADGEITLDGGSLTMKQTDLVDNLYLCEASDEWGNTWDAYKFQSRLYVSGVLNLNSGDLNLTNVIINLEDRGVLNQNGAAVSVTNAAVPADTRRTTGNENNDWIASVNVNEDAVLNVGGGSFVMNHTDMDGGLNIRGSMNMRDGTLSAAVPGGIGIAARGPVHVSGGSLTLSGNIGYEQAYENGFDHGKLTVTGGHMDIDAVSGGIDAYNNMVVTGGQIDVTVTGRVDDHATQDAVAVHGLYGTGIVAYNEERPVSVSINGGIVNIELPVDVQGYEEVQLFALAGFDNGTIRINGGDVHTKGRVALYAESRTEGKHLVINNRLHVLSMETGNTLNLTSGVVTHIVDGNTYTWYVDTCEEDEEFTTPKDNRMQVGYANDLRIVSKTAGTNAFWDMEDGVLTISAGSGKIGNMVKNADWNLVADKVTDLILDQNVEQPTDLTQDLFPNLQSVKTPCHMPAAKFTGVTVELVHDLVNGQCQKCDYSEAPADDIHIKINTDNMTLGNSLAINFWVYKNQLRDGVEYTAKLIRTHESGVTETSLIPMSEWDEYGTYYQVVYDQFAAKEMTDTVSIEILMPNGGSASNVFTDSIQEYAMFMLGYSKDAELLTALVDMLNYGTEAQKAFGYQVNDLANARLTAAQQAIATTGFETDDHWGKTGTGYASNLELKDRITLHLWFTGVTSDMYAIVTFTGHNGRNVETRVEFDEFYKQSGGAYSVPINDLVVADGFQPVTCTLYNANGEVVGTCTDSVQSYISYMTQYVASDKYNELYNATMKFVTSAYNIFH